MSEIVIACCQLAPRFGELDANRAAAEDAIAQAAQDGAHVVVLPELAITGYVFNDADEARSLAEPLDGPTTQAWTRLARTHGIVIVGGICERDDRGALRNTAVLIDPDGIKARYCKAHLWDREMLIFEPGSEPPPAIETRHGRIGVVVCYDLEFPEWTRLPALQGAELLCAPLNWPRYEWPAGERPSEITRVQAAASSNRMFIAACDRAGVERGVEWISGSVIVDPSGFPIAGPVLDNRVTTIAAHIDLADARDKRVSDRNDVLKDRRPELYGALTSSRT